MMPLILIGGGGHCLSVIDAALSAGIKIAGILDPALDTGDMIGGIPVVGDDNDIPLLAASGRYAFLVTLGSIKNPARRIALQKMVEDAEGILASVIASTAYVSPLAEIAPGTVVLHRAIVNAGAKIGKGCIINTSAIVEHCAQIGDYVHISTGAIVNGDCSVCSDTFIGSNATISSQVQISAPSVIGAGAVVVRDIDTIGTYVGVPAHRI